MLDRRVCKEFVCRNPADVRTNWCALPNPVQFRSPITTTLHYPPACQWSRQKKLLNVKHLFSSWYVCRNIDKLCCHAVPPWFTFLLGCLHPETLQRNVAPLLHLQSVWGRCLDGFFGVVWKGHLCVESLCLRGGSGIGWGVTVLPIWQCRVGLVTVLQGPGQFGISLMVRVCRCLIKEIATMLPLKALSTWWWWLLN